MFHAKSIRLHIPVVKTGLHNFTALKALIVQGLGVCVANQAMHDPIHEPKDKPFVLLVSVCE